jgi:hypothetical protein
MPPIRHEIAGSLSPLGMLSEVFYRRLAGQPTDPGKLLDSAEKMRKLTHGAITTINNLITWLDSKPEKIMALGDGLTECIDLLHPEFFARGVKVRAASVPASLNVACTALRTVLTATLLAAADSTRYPIDIQLTVSISTVRIALSLDTYAVDREPTHTLPPNFRSMLWEDVAILAAAESVSLSKLENRVTLGFHNPDFPPL